MVCYNGSRDKIMDYQSRINKLKNLPQMRNKTDAELITYIDKKDKVKKRKQEEEKNSSLPYTPQWSGLNVVEQKWAQQRYDEYLKYHHYIDNYSDLQILEELVWTEAISERYKIKIEKLDENTNLSNIPKELLTSLNEFQKRAIQLKEKLGLFEERKQSTFLDFWIKFKTKLLNWSLTHRGQFQMKCPHCGNMVLLLRKIDDYNTFDFTMFKGTVLYNYEMFKDVHEGKITIEDMSRYWGIPLTDYCKGMYERVFLVDLEKNKNKTLIKNGE